MQHHGRGRRARLARLFVLAPRSPASGEQGVEPATVGSIPTSSHQQKEEQ